MPVLEFRSHESAVSESASKVHLVLMKCLESHSAEVDAAARPFSGILMFGCESCLHCSMLWAFSWMEISALKAAICHPSIAVGCATVGLEEAEHLADLGAAQG